MTTLQLKCNTKHLNVMFCFLPCSDIKRKVQHLETGGTTALGPALALCVGMASNFPSAEVILCTDGVSNVGVGNLEGGRSDSGFYSTVRRHA